MALSILPKKQTKRTQDTILSVCFCSFLGRIDDALICFRDFVTLIELSFLLFWYSTHNIILVKNPVKNLTAVNIVARPIEIDQREYGRNAQTKSIAGHLAKLVDIYLEMGSSCICKATSFTPSQLSTLYALCLSLFYSWIFFFELSFQFLYLIHS